MFSDISAEVEYSRYKNIGIWSTSISNKTNKFNILHLNIRSLRKHFNQLLVLINQSKSQIDVIVLSEVNIKEDEVSCYNVNGYSTYSKTRESTRGGGLLIYVKSQVNFTMEDVNYLGMEVLHGIICLDQRKINLLSVYRPPQKNKILFIRHLELFIQRMRTCEDLIIIGDMNIDLSKNNMNATTISYKNTLCGYGLQCGIPSTEITREAIVNGRLETSCIDHVWVRARRQHVQDALTAASVIECGISDHHIVGISLDFDRKNCKGSLQTSTRSVLDDKQVEVKLDNYDWSQLLLVDCPLSLYNKLCHVFELIYRECTVTKSVKRGRITQPWINKTLYVMIVKRDELFRVWKASPNNMNKRLEYTKYRNKVNKLINIARNKYRRQEIKECQNDYKKIWNTINSWLGRIKLNVDEVVLRYLGKSDNVHNICTRFSETFTKEILCIKHTCDVKFLVRDSYVNKIDLSFRYKKVSAIDVEKIISNLNSKKAPGIDKIRIKDIKYIRKQLCPILAKFINLCVIKSVYPENLKKSYIRPIYKNGNHLDYTNYRPIAILSVINKIVEKVVVGQVSGFLEKHNILTDSQHGFRKGRSTGSALAQFSDEINSRLNEGKQVLALFIDYKKAFDTLDHEVLLQAMRECGIDGPVNDWFRSYLAGRTIRTSIAGTTGAECDVTLGVPTGSVYGPVGYVMLVNSVVNVIKKCKVYMYADDMCLLYSHADISEAHRCIQSDFDEITKWAHDNGIIINISKTKSMHIYSPYNRRAKSVNYNEVGVIGHGYDCLHNRKDNKCNCEPLEYVNTYKYLGMHIDHNFNWKTHINVVCSKLRSVMGKMYYLHKLISKKTMLVVYYALAESVICYGLNVYGRTFQTYIEEIKKLQIRSLKYLLDSKTKNNLKGVYEKLYKMYKILPVTQRVQYLIAIDNYYNNKYKVFKKSRYRTKNIRIRKYVQHFVKNYYGRRTDKFLVPKIYNDIECLREENKYSIMEVKNKLKKILLDNLP